MATHSTIVIGIIPWREGDWRLQSMEPQSTHPGAFTFLRPSEIMATFKGTVQMPKLSRLYVIEEKLPILSMSKGLH